MLSAAKVLKKLSSLKKDIQDTFSEPEPPPLRPKAEEKKVETPPRWKPDMFCSDAEKLARERAQAKEIRDKHKKKRDEVRRKYNMQKS